MNIKSKISRSLSFEKPLDVLPQEERKKPAGNPKNRASIAHISTNNPY